MKDDARAVLDMLRRHYLPETKPPGGIFAPEIGAPDSDRRADLIWQGITAGFGKELVGHEIKVTRRDLQIELQDPTKSDAWMRFCDRWWLVVPDPALVEGFELPPHWGVMAPPSGRRTRSMTVLVDAPKLKPYPQAPAYLRLATWLFWRQHEDYVRLQGERQFQQKRSEQDERRIRDLEKRLLAGEGERYTSSRVELARKIIDAIGISHSGTLGDGWEAEVEIDEVVEALLDLKKTRGRTRHMQRKVKYDLDNLSRAHMDLGHFLETHKVNTLFKDDNAK